MDTHSYYMDNSTERIHDPMAAKERTNYRIRGYRWEKQKHIGINVKFALESFNGTPQLGKWIALPYWHFIYKFHKDTICKFGHTKNAWVNHEVNSVHLFKPGSYFQYDNREVPSPVRSVRMSFETSDPIFMKKFSQNTMNFICIYDPRLDFLKLVLKMIDCGEELEQIGYWKAQGILCEIIYLLEHVENINNNTFRIRRRHSQKTSNLVKEVRRFLSLSLDDKLSINSLVRKLGISRTTLFENYKKTTGETPLITHANMRLERVKNRLILGDPLETIAEEMGFCDMFHLSRYFKKHIGISPRDFLKQIRQGKVE